ncbi:SRPBCC family protein [Jatrophihabitans sp.]|uniref:SRPBCC family protein n=1 Tax=Jatrophihabitans sp. TaxID=1932789 RepID=UPI002C501AF5|nr:SRPBCC family protein [Jatrophihabitans sp.]
MTETRSARPPLFEASAQVAVASSPEQVYRVVTDLPRSGEWSVECRGGRWVSGEAGAVGSVFRGENFRSPEVVAWAPVVRGDWTTESEVVAAEPARRFAWAMRTKAGQKQESIWSFEIEPGPDGSVLAHRFRMDAATEGIQGITASMNAEEKQRFFAEWSAKLERDLAETLDRLKKILDEG